jgi:D-alanyl-D-alanine dipeptidase
VALQGRFARLGFRGVSASDIISRVSRLFRLSFALSFSFGASFFPVSTPPQAQTAASVADSLRPGPEPPDAPAQWKKLIGIYGHDRQTLVILERDKQLYLHKSKDQEWWIASHDNGTFTVHRPDRIPYDLSFHQGNSGEAVELTFQHQGFARADAGADPAHFYHVTPAPPVAELREKALEASPPKEAGPFQKPDLVELATLDPAIRLDIRYASSNNFLSTPVYTQARAFMQWPAAEALVRVLHKLEPLGYGLLIHDAYRPWYVTKIFWDATPPEGKIFVADPQKGSKHNRGCAVDLTLYDLQTGESVEMPGLYDEMSPRSFPNFPGGTSLQRWHRDLLRRAMESEGFTVNEDEWWHFDYKEWKQYPILNVPFEKIAVGR